MARVLAANYTRLRIDRLNARGLHCRRWRWANDGGTRNKPSMWVAPMACRRPPRIRSTRVSMGVWTNMPSTDTSKDCASDSTRTSAGQGYRPWRYFRLLLTGYSEGLDAERAIAWRAADSFALRGSRELVLPEASPDHSTIPHAPPPRSRNRRGRLHVMPACGPSQSLP